MGSNLSFIVVIDTSIIVQLSKRQCRNLDNLKTMGTMDFQQYI